MMLGAHVGTSGGIAKAHERGKEIGAEAIQIFSKSPQMWKGPPILPEAAAAFQSAVKSAGLQRTGIHHCYLTNLASPDPRIQASSRAAFLDELHRAEQLGVDHVIFHPGSHLGAGFEEGSQRIVDALLWAIGEAPNGKFRILLENAAGQGNAVGSTFEELASILDRLAPKERFGITVDTCHLFAAGNDFRTAEGYAAVVEQIRSTVGIRRVGAFHLNDSKAELGKHLDRHENIGKGHIGTAGFKPWVNDPSWAKVPGYLETPMGDDEYAAYVTDLATLRSLLD